MISPTASNAGGTNVGGTELFTRVKDGVGATPVSTSLGVTADNEPFTGEPVAVAALSIAVVGVVAAAILSISA